MNSLNVPGRKININLPPNWSTVRLADICKTTSGGTPSRKIAQYYKGNIPWLKSGELQYNTINSSEEHISKDAIENSSAKIITKGAILIALYGATVGKLAILGIDAAINQAICAIFTPKEIENKFLYWYLFRHRNQLLNSRKGGAQPNISQQIIDNIVFPLPPLSEQKMIVAKLEELLTKLAAGMEGLKKTQILLKQYRQSVLNEAIKGELTKKWREDRRFQLQLESAELENKIEERNKNQKQKNNTLSLNNRKFYSLPDTWIQTKLNLACYKIQDGSHFSPKDQYDEYNSNRFLYITAKNITEHGLDISKVTYVDRKFHEEIYRRCNPEKGDVLLVKDGVKTGIATINYLEEQFSLLSSVALFKPVNEILSSYYLKHFFNSPTGFNLTTGQMTGTAIKRIILDKIRNSPIPIPTLSEQKEIVKQIELHLSIFQNASHIIQTAIRRINILHRSILNIAFEGKLILKDQSDKKAQILLEKNTQEKK